MGIADQLAAMAELQDSLNRNVHATWRTQGHQYYRAIWIECAELLDHFGWKWWKHQRPDLDQVKLEIVDIWHFGLSELIREGSIDHGRIDEHVVAAFADWSRQPRDFREAVETLAQQTLAQRAFPVAEFVDVMSALPIDLDELYRIYIGKNVLNVFRQANGYQSGAYVKVWQGREDNEHLFELVGTLDAGSSSFYDDLYRALETRYAESIRS
ncbi:MAG TPA: dUTP diphosphatase [Pseudomonadales bacterium]